MSLRLLLALGFFLILMGTVAPAQAQGCSACRDATAGSAPKARQGLRRGILALGVPALGVVLGIGVAAWKVERHREREE